MGEVYRIERLTKFYRGAKTAANQAIDLTLPAGEIVGVFGPNGAGKTTLLRQLVGLLRPSSGSVTLLGHDVVRDPDVCAWLVAYFGQRVAALRNHTLAEVIIVTGVLRGAAPAAARRRATELIGRFQLEPLADRRLSTLSGGEQRLALLVSTFVGERPVLVLDEPTNEVDPVRRRTIWEHLRSFQAAGGTVLLATHNLAEAEFAVDRVVVIDQGRLVASGTPGELKRRVSDRVRLEVRLRESGRPGAEGRLASFDSARRIEAGHWEIITSGAAAASVLPRVLDLVGAEALDDFRLVTPSLDDVYLALTGQRWDAPR